MRLLLDTNIAYFLAADRDFICQDVLQLLEDYDNQLYISAESLRELIVAYRNKRLGNRIWKNEREMLESIENKLFINILPIGKEHMMTYACLETDEAAGHKDPSDHVIISHAITENIPLVSSDTRFPFYCNQGLQLIQNKR